MKLKRNSFNRRTKEEKLIDKTPGLCYKENVIKKKDEVFYVKRGKITIA